MVVHLHLSDEVSEKKKTQTNWKFLSNLVHTEYQSNKMLVVTVQGSLRANACSIVENVKAQGCLEENS